jgi:outer membrane lipoprotein-sorting protein
MRRGFLALTALVLLAIPLSSSAFAQTADEIVAKYVKAIGGIDKINALKTLNRSGKFTGGGGFEARVTQENKRPNLVREDFLIQGMDGVTAYDGKTGWKIEPWQGKKDPEPLGEDELKDIIADADFDGPLVNYAAKGNKVEYAGTEPVEGTDAYKLKVTLANGEVRYYYMDTDYYVPIKVETKRMIRGAEREFESSLGDYKEVDGVYFPWSIESGPKGSQQKGKVTYEKISGNTSIAESRFVQPSAAGKTDAQRQGEPADASQMQPKTPQEKQQQKPPANEPKKPPVEK